MKQLIGIISNDGYTVESNNIKYALPIRGIAGKFPEVLIDAKSVGGNGCFHRQSIEPFIGMEVVFVTTDGITGYNFEIFKR